MTHLLYCNKYTFINASTITVMHFFKPSLITSVHWCFGSLRPNGFCFSLCVTYHCSASEKISKLPKANSVDRVNPRPYHPLGVPEILLLSWLVDFLSSSGFSVVCLTWTVLSLFSPCCLLPWASGLKSADPWPRHCHLTSSHQLCSTRHQHFGRGRGQMAQSPHCSQHPAWITWWTMVLTVWLTLVRQADISPYFTGRRWMYIKETAGSPNS